ncbi:MAG: T9SS type A sorting domain-containing protein [Bacteroidota bacterium]
MKNISLKFIFIIVPALLAVLVLDAPAQHVGERAVVKNPTLGFWGLLEKKALKNIPASAVARAATPAMDGEVELQPSAQKGIQVHGFLGGRVKRLPPIIFSEKQVGEPGLETIPRIFSLDQNYPNPFNPTTMIRFTLPEDGRVTLHIYDVIGREVATLVEGERKSGVYQEVVFDASRLASGMYFSRIQFGDRQLIRKMMLVK